MFTIKNNTVLKFVLLLSIFSSAGAYAKTAAELAEEQKNYSLYGEIAIGALFVVALTLFIVWKSKHDKKEREKHLKQMQKMQANKKRAA